MQNALLVITNWRWVLIAGDWVRPFIDSRDRPTWKNEFYANAVVSRPTHESCPWSSEPRQMYLSWVDASRYCHGHAKYGRGSGKWCRPGILSASASPDVPGENHSKHSRVIPQIQGDRCGQNVWITVAVHFQTFLMSTDGHLDSTQPSLDLVPSSISLPPHLKIQPLWKAPHLGMSVLWMISIAGSENGKYTRKTQPMVPSHSPPSTSLRTRQDYHIQPADD